MTLDGYTQRLKLLKQMTSNPFYRANAVTDDAKLILRARKTTVKAVFGAPHPVNGDRWTYDHEALTHPISQVIRFKDGSVVDVSRTEHGAINTCAPRLAKSSIS